MMHLSGHPHVVGFKGVYEDASHVHIVMELCTGGERFEHIAAKGHYRERDAAHIMRSIVMVVEHCHAMNVVHRDLKVRLKASACFHLASADNLAQWGTPAGPRPLCEVHSGQATWPHTSPASSRTSLLTVASLKTSCSVNKGAAI